MTPERVHQLLAAATLGPWTMGKAVDPRDIPLIVAAPEIATAYLDLAAKVQRIEALFAGGPDTPCATTWRDHGLPESYGVPKQECVEVPIDDLREALGV